MTLRIAKHIFLLFKQKWNLQMIFHTNRSSGSMIPKLSFQMSQKKEKKNERKSDINWLHRWSLIA